MLFWMHHRLPLVHSIMHSLSRAATTAWRATTTHDLRSGGPALAMQPMGTYPAGATGRQKLMPVEEGRGQQAAQRSKPHHANDLSCEGSRPSETMPPHCVCMTGT